MKEERINKVLIWQSDSHQSSSRVFALDLLKAISIAAVVFYHSIFVPISTYANAAIPELILSASFRFCVPVFFTISFMLFERELSKENDDSQNILKKRLFRIFIPTAFWFGISIVLQLIKGNQISQLLLDSLTGTIFIGAFFLVVLLQLTLIFVALRRWLRFPINIWLVVVVQAFAFLIIQMLIYGTFNSLGDAVIDVLRTINRSLIVYWFGYMAVGYYCYHHWSFIHYLSSRLSVLTKLLLLGIMSVIMTIEYAYLITHTPGDFTTFEYALVSCIISVFVIFVCFAAIKEHHVPAIARPAIQLLSKYSLGIFCINGILSQGLALLGRQLFSEASFTLPEIFSVRLIGWCVLLPLSLGIAMLLDRVGLKNCVR